MIPNPVYPVTLFDCPPFHMLDFGDCPRARNIKDDGEFEPTSMRLWCKLAREASCILDIGAHVGVYSLAAAMLCKGPGPKGHITQIASLPRGGIHAFEPNPFAYTRLREHVRLNELEHCIEEHHHALSDKEGIAPFTWAWKPCQPISSGGAISMPFPGQATETYPVMTTPLDSLGLHFGARPLVKIDVEGGEVEVFRGAAKLLAAKPDIILECFDSAKADEIWPLLKNVTEDYRAYSIHEKSGKVLMNSGLRGMDNRGCDFNQFLTTRKPPFTS